MDSQWTVPDAAGLTSSGLQPLFLNATYNTTSQFLCIAVSSISNNITLYPIMRAPNPYQMTLTRVKHNLALESLYLTFIISFQLSAGATAVIAIVTAGYFLVAALGAVSIVLILFQKPIRLMSGFAFIVVPLCLSSPSSRWFYTVTRRLTFFFNSPSNLLCFGDGKRDHGLLVSG